MGVYTYFNMLRIKNFKDSFWTKYFYLFYFCIISTYNNTEEIVNTESTTSISLSKPVFLYMTKFMSMEYKDMQSKLNEIILATNVSCKYYPVENKATSP